MKHPFDEYAGRIESRNAITWIYKQVTGRDSIPDQYQYWTLCNVQSSKKGSEINQLHRLGFLKKSQFHGVDRTADFIRKNRRLHRTAHWYQGEWLDVIRMTEDFHPSLINLDTQHVAGGVPAAGLTYDTMLLCPTETVMMVNVMLNNPRSSDRFEGSDFITYLQARCGASIQREWLGMRYHYPYTSTPYTHMAIYVFIKRY